MWFTIGGVIGVIVVGAFFLDPFEAVGWRMFWSGIAKGDLPFNQDMILNSTTFSKCCIGFFIDGTCSAILKWIFKNKHE